MIEPPQIAQIPTILTAKVHVTIPRAEIRNAMGPGLRDLRAGLEAQNVRPIGPWFTHHLRMDPGVFDFEICVPVSQVVQAVGRMQSGEISAGRVARTVFRGPYEALGMAWNELETWIAQNGQKSATDLWEVYVKGPESGQDPSKWETQLNRRLLD